MRISISSSVIASKSVDRAANSGRSPSEDMGVDHRRLDVLVPQQFLHRPDVVTVLQTAVKANETANPVDAGLLGPVVVMPGAQDLYRAVAEPRSWFGRERPIW
jgi:hypothetical protein